MFFFPSNIGIPQTVAYLLALNRGIYPVFNKRGNVSEMNMPTGIRHSDTVQDLRLDWQRMSHCYDHATKACIKSSSALATGFTNIKHLTLSLMHLKPRCTTDTKKSSSPATITTCQESWASGMFMLCYIHVVGLCYSKWFTFPWYV